VVRDLVPALLTEDCRPAAGHCPERHRRAARGHL